MTEDIHIYSRKRDNEQIAKEIHLLRLTATLAHLFASKESIISIVEALSNHDGTCLYNTFSYRTIVRSAPTRVVREGGGFLVRRPRDLSDLQSPFLLLDEFGPVTYAPGEAKGAPWHPHRGFETVSYIIEGSFRHQDSTGLTGTTGPGDVQWMTAGRGVIHDERPSEELLQKGGSVHGFQIWVNLPRKSKMMKPRYQEVPANNSPVIEKDGVWARVIAGSFLGISSTIDTVAPITLIHVKMSSGARVVHDCEKGSNIMLYMMKGSVQIGNGDEKIFGLGKEHNLVILSDGEKVDLHAHTSDAEFLILGGQEYNEPIARYGPFVMNTKSEIDQAIRDYQTGNFLDHEFEIPYR